MNLDLIIVLKAEKSKYANNITIPKLRINDKNYCQKNNINSWGLH